MTWTLRIDGWHPPLLNKLLRTHWAKRDRVRNATYQQILVACQNAHAPKAVGKRKVTLTWVMGPRNRQPDADGCWKYALDALVACGRLRNDNPTWVECAPVQFERGPTKGIILTLEDIEE